MKDDPEFVIPLGTHYEYVARSLEFVTKDEEFLIITY